MSRYTAVAVLVVSVLTLAACQPMGPLPGGRLSGEIQPPPADWTAADAEQVVQLETRSNDPYSVNVWGTGIGKHYYVAAGRSNTRWLEHLATDPHVRLKIGADLYALRAVRVEDPEEQKRVFTQYVAKYQIDPEEQAEATSTATLYRLDPRESL